MCGWLLATLWLAAVSALAGATHSNNWAVIVDASRYWFNYRHSSNALSVYHAIRARGVPDSQIILMLADDMACNPRNRFPGQIFNNWKKKTSLYDEDVEVDYRGEEVSVENLLRLLTGRHSPNVARSKRLLTDARSNILLFLTGHGGAGFLKFQDKEELSSQDLADAFFQMRQQNRYHEVLVMTDTCQASTLHERFFSSGIVSIGSSALGENSYSHHSDKELGITVIDRFTHHTLEYLQRLPHRQLNHGPSLVDLFRSYSPKLLLSHPDWRTDLFNRSLHEAPLSDFFSAMSRVRGHFSEPQGSSASEQAFAATRSCLDLSCTAYPLIKSRRYSVHD